MAETEDVITYRSGLTSIGVLVTVFAVVAVGACAVLLGATALGLPTGAVSAGLPVALGFATWRAGRLSIRIDGGSVVIRNPWCDHRVDDVHAVSTSRNWSARGMPCLSFVMPDGRSVPAVAGTIWLRGVLVERPGRTVDELAWFICEIEARQSHQIRLAVPDVLRTAVRRLRSPISPSD